MAKRTQSRVHEWTCRDTGALLLGAQQRLALHTLSRRRYRKQSRQWRKAARAEAQRVSAQYRRFFPDLAAVLTGLGSRGTTSHQPEVLDLLDTTPLNLQDTSPL